MTKKIGIGKKLLIGYMIDAGFALLVCSVSIFLFFEIKKSLFVITSGEIPGLRSVSMAGQEARRVESILLDLKNVTAHSELNKSINELMVNWKNIERHLNRYEPKILDGSPKNIDPDFSDELNQLGLLISNLATLHETLKEKIEIGKKRVNVLNDAISLRDQFNKTYFQEQFEQIAIQLKKVTENSGRDQKTSTKNRIHILNVVKTNDWLLALSQSSQNLFSYILDSITTSELSVLNRNVRKSLTEIRNFEEILSRNRSSLASYPGDWINQVEGAMIGPDSFIHLRRREIRLINTSNGLIKTHIELANQIDQKSTIIANKIHNQINLSAKKVEDKIMIHTWQLLFATLFGVVGVFLIMIVYIGKKLVIPLLQTSQAMLEVAEGNEKVALPVARTDEIGDVILALEKIKQYVANVKELALKLGVKTHDINNMLQNMKQGIFTIVGENKIHREYSKHLEFILEESDLASKDAIRLLFSRSDLDSDRIDSIKSALNFSIGESVVSFNLNFHIYPTEIKRQTLLGQLRVLEVDWIPIVTEERMVDRILVIVKDVTELRNLRSESLKHRKEIEIMIQILTQRSRDPGKTLKILKKDARRILKLISNQKGFVSGLAAVEEIYRLAHTLKGNARQCGFSFMSSEIHRFESYLNRIIKNKELFVPKTVSSRFSLVYRIVDFYYITYFKKLNAHFNHFEASLKVLDDSRKLLKDTDLHQIENENIKFVLESIKNSGFVEREDFVQSLLIEVKSLATQLKKSEPRVHFSIDNESFGNMDVQILQNCLVHLLSNSLIHGIEDSDLRVLKGKNPNGTIRIDITVNNGYYQIKYEDDGQGLDMDQLNQKRLNLYSGENLTEISEEELGNSIFEFGLSTSSGVSEISGRGVGLSSVKSHLLEIGGNIHLELKNSSVETEKNKMFSFLIEIPVNQSFVKTA